MEPPYWMVRASAAALPYRPATVERMQAQTSFAWAAVAVLPVPMAQMGS